MPTSSATNSPPKHSLQQPPLFPGGGMPQNHVGAQRRKQSPQGKNGSPTLDLVELKDMNIQKLNQVAKDMGVAGAAGF